MEIFLEISLITAIVTIVSLIMKVLKQPFIVGYILTGILVGPYAFNILRSTESIEFFSKVGITILLYIVGLNLNPKVLKEVGKVSLTTGITQVVLNSLIGFFICKALGIGNIPSLYISIALSFSSTIIILKLLTDKGDLNTLYGKISIGFLLVQDLIATIIIVIISAISYSRGGNITFALSMLALKGIIAGLLFFLLSKYIVPKITDFISESTELLFLFSLSWGMAVASIFYYLGFSVEIGALVAGVTLSSLPYTPEISSRIKPLRDFFIVLFFILLGSRMALSTLPLIILPAIILSFYVLIGNPLILFVLMNLLGYKRKTSFMAGLTVAQISEFSIILAGLGVTIGHLSTANLSLITLIGLITISGSTYLILYSDNIYRSVEKFLKYIEIKKFPKETKLSLPNQPDIILFGYDRSGAEYIKAIQQLDKNYVIIDYSPQAIDKLKQANLPHVYGDAEDIEFLEEIGINHAKLVISTIPNYDTNKLIVQKLTTSNPKAISIVVCHQVKDTLDLYEIGASYVIVPIYFGSQYLSHLLNKHGLEREAYQFEKSRHLLDLQNKI